MGGEISCCVGYKRAIAEWDKESWGKERSDEWETVSPLWVLNLTKISQQYLRFMHLKVKDFFTDYIHTMEPSLEWRQHSGRQQAYNDGRGDILCKDFIPTKNTTDSLTSMINRQDVRMSFVRPHPKEVFLTCFNLHKTQFTYHREMWEGVTPAEVLTCSSINLFQDLWYRFAIRPEYGVT